MQDPTHTIRVEQKKWNTFNQLRRKQKVIVNGKSVVMPWNQFLSYVIELIKKDK